MSRTRERRAASDVASIGPERIRSRVDSWYAKCSLHRPLLSAPRRSIERQAEYAGVPFVDPQVLNPDVVTHRVTPRTLDDVAHAKARAMHHNRKSGSQEIAAHSAQRVLVAKSAVPRAGKKRIAEHPPSILETDLPRGRDTNGRGDAQSAVGTEPRRGTHDGEQKHTSR